MGSPLTVAASSDITAIRARFIWAGPGRVHAPGEVVIAQGRIVSIGRLVRRARVLDCAVFPGLVNAHAHLQLGRLGHVERRFLPWVRAVMSAARETSRQDLARRAQRSIRSLVRSGTTAVGEIDSTGLSSAELRSTGFAGRCYQELLGHDLGPQAARRELISRGVQGSRPCPAGWSPHAPYSVSPALFRAAARSGLPLMVHAAETEEEMQFLHTGRGPFRDLLEELGRIPSGFKPARLGAVRWLDRLGILDSSCAVVHAQHLEEGEAELLHRHGTAIVVCPGTIRHFRRAARPLREWLDLGISVALGTDSLASNTRLSMLVEMRRARQLWPDLPPEAVLAMATAAGGRALARPSLGILARGGRADVVCADTAGYRDMPTAVDAFTMGELSLRSVMLGGKRVDF